MSYVCSPSHTLHKSEGESVTPTGEEKMKLINNMFTVMKLGIFLPVQPMYQKSTVQCTPLEIGSPNGFNTCFTKNASQRTIGTTRYNEKSSIYV